MSTPHASPDVAAEITRWIGHLGAERRMSPKTLESYRRDVSQFLSFLADHLGGAPTLKQLAKLAPADVRAFMAARRSEGIGNRSLMRAIAGTLMNIGRGYWPESQTTEILEAQDRTQAGPTAPAQGLFLMRVTYAV